MSDISAESVVLIVDDEEQWRKLLSDILLEDGYEVVCASGEKEALRLLYKHRNRVRVAIIDKNLEQWTSSDTSGLELAELIRQSDPHCKVVMLTGYPDHHSTRQAFKGGVIDFLAKDGTFSPDELRRIVSDAIPRNPITVLHLSDLHFGPAHRFQRFPRSPVREPTRLEETLIRSLEFYQKRPDIIVVSGDLSDAAETSQFNNAQRCICALQQHFGIDTDRVIVVPGNHDVHWDSEPEERFETYSSFSQVLYGDGLRKSPFLRVKVVKLENKPMVAILGLDSCVVESPERAGIGYVGTVQMDRASELMKRETKDDVECVKIAVLHHHLLPVTTLRSLPDQGKYFSLVTDAAMVLSRLQQEGVNLVLHGHQHYPFFCEVRYGFDSAANIPFRPMSILGMGSVGAKVEDNFNNYYGLLQIARGEKWNVNVSWYRAVSEPVSSFEFDREFSLLW